MSDELAALLGDLRERTRMYGEFTTVDDVAHGVCAGVAPQDIPR